MALPARTQTHTRIYMQAWRSVRDVGSRAHVGFALPFPLCARFRFLCHLLSRASLPEPACQCRSHSTYIHSISMAQYAKELDPVQIYLPCRDSLLVEERARRSGSCFRPQRLSGNTRGSFILVQLRLRRVFVLSASLRYILSRLACSRAVCFCLVCFCLIAERQRSCACINLH